MSEHARVLVNGRADIQLSPLDRGFCYGDGVFETIRCIGRHRILWSRHIERLISGCSRLKIPAPNESVLAAEVGEVCEGQAEAVVRITISRGAGTRGYAFSPATEPTRVVAAFAKGAAFHAATRVRWCDLILGDQTVLAGMKHLNRLEAIMARAEWNDPSIGEGLVCDARGNVICAVSANLFAVIDGALVTPDLARCGVEGVLRAEIIDTHPSCTVREIGRHALMNATEVFLTNSVRGICPVQAIDDTLFWAGAQTNWAQELWRTVSTHSGGRA